jgi:release factor glutamine methyltransferase
MALDPPGYQPDLPAEEVERIRRWHERSYALTVQEAAAGPQTFTVFDRTFVVPPEVQPIATGQAPLLARAVLDEVRPGDRVLDMGTGCGINAILAAGTATDVLAVDVNPIAVQAARDNAARNGVAERIRVHESDVYSAVDGAFDLIIFDPPFRWFTPRTLLERASTDAGYQTLTAFFDGLDAHLTPDGRVLLFFGTSGDIAHLHRLIAQAGRHAEVVAHEHWERDDRVADYYTYRIR